MTIKDFFRKTALLAPWLLAAIMQLSFAVMAVVAAVLPTLVLAVFDPIISIVNNYLMKGKIAANDPESNLNEAPADNGTPADETFGYWYITRALLGKLKTYLIDLARETLEALHIDSLQKYTTYDKNNMKQPLKSYYGDSNIPLDTIFFPEYCKKNNTTKQAWSVGFAVTMIFTFASAMSIAGMTALASIPVLIYAVTAPGISTKLLDMVERRWSKTKRKCPPTGRYFTSNVSSAWMGELKDKELTALERFSKGNAETTDALTQEGGAQITDALTQKGDAETTDSLTQERDAETTDALTQKGDASSTRARSRSGSLSSQNDG